MIFSLLLSSTQKVLATSVFHEKAWEIAEIVGKTCVKRCSKGRCEFAVDYKFYNITNFIFEKNLFFKKSILFRI